ncbi:sensor domain-containing diguanylate cyclase [Leptolyngbya sp. BL0902]|uniref:PAS domain-containing protein n=1 Tax=Leptolyngbya sp. BL0902 TaxID=1115757 RepID=UPI0018E8ED86|nr:PAS domain-containing protein [Leptolyngbya sp. BL0902]QQE65202.1 sensor domain-containing diguanylate cyclase [Leptolyngbya sp. BL0902]
MSTPPTSGRFSPQFASLSLRTLMLAVLALQMAGVVGLIIFLSYRPDWQALGILSLVVIIAAMGVGLLAIDRLLQSLQTLKRAAQAMAQGQWHPPLQPSRFGEMRQLMLAFNHMAAQLQGSFAELEYFNQALATSEQRWREFLDAIPLGIVVYDRNGQLVFASAEARRMLGLENLPSVPNLSLAETFLAYRADGAEPYPVEELPVTQSLHGDRGWADDLILRQGNHSIPVEMASTPIFERTGRVEFAVAAFQDITTRQQAQQVLTDYSHTLEATVAQRTDALHQAQITQRVILQAIPDLLMRYNRDGICLDVLSTGSVAMLAPPSTQLGRSLAEVLPADMVAERMRYIHLTLDTGRPQQYEYRFETSMGWRHEEARLVMSGEDEVLIIVRDITERKQAEIALRESQALYRSLTDVLPHGLYRLDRQHRLTFTNPAYLSLINCTSEDCLGKTAFDLFPAAQAQRYVEDDEGVMSTGSALNKVEIYVPPGRSETHYLQMCKTPLYDENGTIVGMQGVFWDVTELKQTEAALARQKQFLQNVIDSIPSIIVVKDRESRIQMANQASAALHGMTPEAMLGRQDVEMNPNVSPQEAEENYRINQHVIDTAEPYQSEQEIADVHGVSRWYQILVNPFRDTNGNINGVVGNCIDITDRKQIETALQEANEKLERLATLDGLTHIPNRRRFDQYLEQSWQCLVREQQPLSLILFDVDYFKLYNDHFGHQQGDEGLIAIAEAASRAVKRSADLIARYGGEEFGVILPNTNRIGAENVAKAIQQEVADLQLPHPKSEISDYLTVSIGIASTVPDPDQSMEELIATADAALYQAKRRGRNRYWVRLL